MPNGVKCQSAKNSIIIIIQLLMHVESLTVLTDLVANKCSTYSYVTSALSDPMLLVQYFSFGSYISEGLKIGVFH